MNAQALTEFLRKAAQDAELRERLEGLAAEHGLDLGLDELEEADLKRVVGGVMTRGFGVEGESQDKNHGTEIDILEE